MTGRPLRTLITLGAVVVLLAMAVGALWWFDHRNRLTEAVRPAALQAAQEQVATALAEDSAAPPIGVQGAIDADVVASSVVRANPEQVVVLLFVNQTAGSAPSEVRQLSAHRIELTMTRADGRWLISDLERV